MYTRCIMFLVVLAVIFTELPLSSCFQWIRPNGNVETKLTLPTRTSKKPFELKWEWNLGNGETTNHAEIKRYKANNKDATVTVIVVLFSDNKASFSNEFKSFYTINAQVGTASGNNGFMKLTITEISNQGNNKDNSPVNLMDANYTYECEVTIRDVSNQPVSHSRTNTLIVLVIPFITTAPQDKLVTNRRTNITLKCVADGKPTPTITWTRTSVLGSQSVFSGEDLVISRSTGDDDFLDSDIGTYNCTATSAVGSVSATALVQYTKCNTGCAIDDKIAIEMTDLTYGSSYENENSNEYKELKKAIETECFTVYSKAVQQVYSCIVTKFRKGSVIANIKITYPTGTEKPRKPLEDAIKTGTFADQKVRTSFVSPTSAGRVSYKIKLIKIRIHAKYTSPPTMTVKTSTTSLPQTTSTSHGQPVSTIPCTESSHVPAIVLGVMFSISLVFNLLFIGHFVWKKRIENKENRNNSSNYNETMYMNNIAFQDQRSNNELQNVEPVISQYQQQDQQQPIPPVYQSVQVHTDTYSSLSPNTKLPPKPAVITNSGDYEDLRGTSHQYQSLDGFSRV